MRGWPIVVAFAAVASASCLRANLTQCADGRACAPAQVCDDVHQTCVSPEQLTACAGSADGTACLAGPVTGACYDQVCLAPGCGNRIVEPGEQCDDGNHVDGDGCSADCRSNEQCGNGIVDNITGETCDDGNLQSHDGCNSRCQVEQVTWTAQPVAIKMAYENLPVFDEHRGRLVYPAGGATWEFDGATWTIPSLSAPPRLYTNGVYDSDRQRVVVLGSFGSQDETARYRFAWRQPR